MNPKLIEVDLSLTRRPIGRFKDRWKAVNDPDPHPCQCGRLVVWDLKCLQCQREEG